MNKKIFLLLSFIILFGLFSYLRWFDFNYSFENNKLKMNLPDFVDSDYLIETGFEYVGDDLPEWKKYDKFSWIINNKVFSDSIEIRLDAHSYEPTFQYPYIGAYKIIMSPEVEKKFKNFFQNKPDSTSKIVLKEYETHYEYYKFDSQHNMIRILSKYDSKKSKYVEYLIYPKKKPNVFQRFFMIIKRIVVIGMY